MNKLVIGLLFASLLVFGCVGGDEAAAPAGGEPAQPPAGGEPAATEPASVEGNVFEGLDYAAIMALGESGECTVTVEDEGASGAMHLWFDGEKSRVEMAMNEGGESVEIVSIYKNDKVYSNFPQAMEGAYGDCDWIEMSEEEESPAYGEEAGATGDYSTPDLEELPEADFECHAASVPASKFDTPGTVCTMDELMEAMTGGQGIPDMGACEGLEGEAYQECLMAMVPQ